MDSKHGPGASGGGGDDEDVLGTQRGSTGSEFFNRGSVSININESATAEQKQRLKQKGTKKNLLDEPAGTTRSGSSDDGGKLQDEPELDPEQLEAEVLAKERRAQNKSQRKFAFLINNIRIKFLNKYNFGGIFLEFEVGGIRREVESNDVEEKQVKKTKEGKDGKKEEFTANIVEAKKKIQIIRKPAKRYFTRIVEIANLTGDIDEPVIFRNHSVSGEWKGSYQQLESDSLTLRVYQARRFAANVLLGEGSIKLKNVAASNVDIDDMIVFKRQEDETVRKEAICIAEFRFELEEIFLFDLEFTDWEMNITQPKDAKEPIFEGCCYFGTGTNEDRTHGITDKRPPVAAELDLPNTLRCGHRLCPFGIPYQIFQLCECGFTLPCTRAQAHLWLRYHANIWASRQGKTSPVADMSYYGTRSALENERIMVRFYKDHYCGGCCAGWDLIYSLRGPNLGYTLVPLQNKLDYGYIIDPDVKLENNSSSILAFLCTPCIKTYLFTQKCCHCGDEDQYKSGYELHAGVKGVITSRSEPRYRQLGNAGRPAGVNRWFTLGRGELYLAIKVVRVKGLMSLTEYKESLCPSVTVDWAQTRRESRTVKDDSEPFFDEWVFFRIPRHPKKAHKVPQTLEDFGKAGKGSKIIFNVWDNSAFTKRPLGYAELEFETIYKNRKQRLIESASAVGSRVSRYVYQSKLDLDVPKLRQGEAVKNLPKERGIEILAYFDMGSSRVGPPKRKNKGKKKKKQEDEDEEPDIPIVRVDGISERHFRQARSFWVQALSQVPEAESRTFAFAGIDEYSGGLYYLPSFVSRLTPPSTIDSMSKILHYVHSIELAPRRNTKQYELARLKLEKLGGKGDLKIWSDPWNFLDQRRGDHRDHAVLLCNFLLGHGYVAYVCTGRVRVQGAKRGGLGGMRVNAKEKQRTEEHVWVMTLEEPSGDSEMPFYKTVRFWESSNGRTYVRMNPPRTDNDIRSIRRKKLGGDDVKEDEELMEDTFKLAAELDTVMEEADDINSGAVLGFPSGGPLSFNYSSNPAGSKNIRVSEGETPDYSVEESKVASRIRYEREKRRFRHQLQKALKVSKASATYQNSLREWEQVRSTIWEESVNKESAVKKASSKSMEGGFESKGKRLKFEDESVLGDDLEDNKHGNSATKDVDGKDDDFDEGSSKNHEENLAPLLHPHQDDTPYVSIDVIFNHEHLYANLQDKHPHKIQYDVYNPDRWKSFRGEKEDSELHGYGGGEQYFWRGKDKVTQFYPGKTMLANKAPEEAVMIRERQLQTVLTGAIEAFREFEMLSTTFIEKFDFQENLGGSQHTAVKYIQHRLKDEQRLGNRCPNLVRIERKRKLNRVIDDLNFIRDLWREDIVAPLSTDREYVESVLHFKHADTSKISDQVIRKIGGSLLKKPDHLNPQYAIGVRIDRLPGEISPVSVMVVCIYSAVESAAKQQ